jgi:thiamine pyrophosphokinase
MQRPSSAEDGFLLQRIIIFANGELPDLARAHSLLRLGDTVICADGGTRHALSLGIRPDLIIGDLDSADPGAVQKFREEGANVETHPRDKNETDLELAINRAVGWHPQQIVIAAALGGRLDQTLGNITLLADPRLFALDARLDDGVEEILLCRDRAAIHGRAGDLVSLIPWQGAASGIRTEGLKWPLQRETLYPDKTRGISNEMTGDAASVLMESGLLLIVHRRL